MKLVLCAVEQPDGNALAHYRVGGEKKGVRRWQNKDGSYTSEGYQHYAEMYGWGKNKAGSKSVTKSQDSDLTAEENELQIMERIEKVNASGKITKKEKAFASRIANGEVLSKDEIKTFKKLSEKHYIDNFDLAKKEMDILKKNDAYSSIKDENEFPEADQKALQKIRNEMLNNRKAYADTDYLIGLAHENQYRKDIKKETDPDYIDPAYRNFSSKEEKAAAEEAYFDRIWRSDDASLMNDKWNRELNHLTNRVLIMSLDGYEGLPKSERMQSMYNYVDVDNTFDRYENWQPRYETTAEWKNLQKEREAVQSMPRKTNQQWKKYFKAIHEIEQKEKPIKEKFQDEAAKNCLLDLGWEVTPKSIEMIKGLIWYD